MSALIQPVALLLIILAGYLFKRAGLFEDRDYRIMQTIIFNLVLPGAIVYSFATNPHDSSMLLISLFGLIVAFIPPVVVFLTSRHRPVQNRAAASVSRWCRRFLARARSCPPPCSTLAIA